MSPRYKIKSCHLAIRRARAKIRSQCLAVRNPFHRIYSILTYVLTYGLTYVLSAVACTLVPTISTDIWYGEKHQDVRWVPYSNVDPETIGDPNDIKLYDPELEKKPNTTAMVVPPDAETLPLELSKLFKTVQRREDNKEVLEFMRNKHIMVYGSS